MDLSLFSTPLRLGDVHVWQTRLDVEPDVVRRYEQVLSPSESARAERFVFDRHRRRSVVSRGVLRCLLGLYTEQTPQSLTIETTAYGKPFLPADWGIEFNVSHSEDMAVFAFSRSTLGVDVEAIHPMPDALLIAESHFSPDERAELITAQSEAERESLFFRCWTRKEAFIKGHGEGLSLPLKSFSVALHPDQPALLRFDSDPQAVTHWNFKNIHIPGPYEAALVVNGSVNRLHQADWTHEY